MRCFVFSACVFMGLSFVGTVHGGAGWNYYNGPLGPDKWYTQYPHCGGRMQSPINIVTSRVLYDRDLQLFDLTEYSASCTTCSMTLENVLGHTVEVKYSGDPITIRGGSLPDEYILDQFHFHWGATDDKGSEHKLNGRPMQMEMHIVHHSKEYNKTESAPQPYGLAVLGFFLEIGQHNPNFEALLKYFPNVTYEDEKVAITPFALSSLLPPNTSSYYRYYGSLTTPPCYESVIWTIFTEKIRISQQQLDTFRTLLTRKAGDTNNTHISNDFRPVQDLNERRITSNDDSLLHDIAAELVEELRQDILELQKKCGTGGAMQRSVALGVLDVLVMAFVSCVVVKLRVWV